MSAQNQIEKKITIRKKQRKYDKRLSYISTHFPFVFQEQLKDLENRLNRVSVDPTSYSEKKRLKDIIEDKQQQIEKLRRDVDSVKDQSSFYRREVPFLPFL